jgi:hypothetical protein
VFSLGHERDESRRERAEGIHSIIFFLFAIERFSRGLSGLIITNTALFALDSSVCSTLSFESLPSLSAPSFQPSDLQPKRWLAYPVRLSKMIATLKLHRTRTRRPLPVVQLLHAPTLLNPLLLKYTITAFPIPLYPDTRPPFLQYFTAPRHRPLRAVDSHMRHVDPLTPLQQIVLDQWRPPMVWSGRHATAAIRGLDAR